MRQQYHGMLARGRRPAMAAPARGATVASSSTTTTTTRARAPSPALAPSRRPAPARRPTSLVAAASGREPSNARRPPGLVALKYAGPPSSSSSTATSAASTAFSTTIDTTAATVPGRGRLDALEQARGACSLVSRYTPAYVRSRAMRTPTDAVAVLARVVQIMVELGKYGAALAWDSALPSAWGGGDTPQRVRLRAQQLREALTRLGPSFIKAGQVLASRPDIVREDYMNELCVLQDDVPPFPDALAFETIERELGRPLSAVFSSISERPVAAASLGQVYKAVLRDTGEAVAVKVQRPGVEPVVLRDLVIFRALAALISPLSRARLGCDAELVVDEFGEKLLEELDYLQEARNIAEFGRNFAGDATVKIPWVRPDLCGGRVVTMEWIEGIRCTDPKAIAACPTLSVDSFIRTGVVSGLRQLLEFGLFHGDPHPGNIFALPDGRIAYVDFGNVAQLSSRSKATLVDAVVHAVNEDYRAMAGDFVALGFLSPGTDIRPIVPALEKIWRDSRGQSLSEFNFRSVTSRFNELVYQYPIRIPERYSLVIRSLLTQEGICLTLNPDFHFLEVAYPYVARRLLTDEDPALRERLLQVLFQDGQFRWERLANLVTLASETGGGGGGGRAAAGATTTALARANTTALATTTTAPRPGLDLNDTIRDAARLLLTDQKLRRQVIAALTEGNRLRVEEVAALAEVLRRQGGVDAQKLAADLLAELPKVGRQMVVGWADRVLA